MARRKVKLVWIANDSARKASLKKRRLGLVKKVTELATLCAVEAGVIILSPEDQQQTMVWPSHDRLYQVMSRFYSIPETERRKKAMNQEIYLKGRVSKLKDTLKKSMKINNEMEMIDLMYKIKNNSRDFNELDLNEISGLMWLMEEKSRLINRRQGAFFPGDPHLDTNLVPIQVHDQVFGGDDGTLATRTGDFLDWSTPAPLHAPKLDPATWGLYLNLMSADNITGGADLGLHEPEPYQLNGGSHGGALGPDHHVWGMHQEQNYNIDQGGYMNTNMAFAVGGGHEPYYVMEEDVKHIIQQLPSNFPEFGNNNFSYQVANYELQASENNMFIGNTRNLLIEAAMPNGRNYYGGGADYIPMFNYGGATTSGAMPDYGGGADYIPMFNYGGASTDNGGASRSYQLPPTSPNDNFGL